MSTIIQSSIFISYNKQYSVKTMQQLPNCQLFHKANSEPNSVDSPLQLKLIKYLGLKKYMIDNFIFKRKPSKYSIRKRENKNVFFSDHEYEPPFGYTCEVKILQTTGHSVPVLKLKPIKKTNDNVIIYAHGNSSDLLDSLAYIDRLSKSILSQYVIFDYTGYGESRTHDVGEQIICGDIEMVLAWVTKTKSIRDVILWGFSLGSYPVLYAAAKYNVKGVLLQAPIASINCIFHSDLHENIKFNEDYFSNLELIEKVKGRVFIVHSSGDQIIPFSHAKLLFDKYVKVNGHSLITFIEIGKISHNSLHRFIVSPTENELKKEVHDFLKILLREEKTKNKKQSNKSHREEEDPFEQLRQSLTEAHIEELLDDMNQIVISQSQQERIIQKRIQSNKKCLCCYTID